HSLSSTCWRGDDPDRNPVLGDEPFEVVKVMHDQAAYALPELRRVCIDEARGAKPAASEAAVVRESSTKVADADDGDRPVLGQAKFTRDLVDEVGHFVTNTSGAVRTEVRQVLAKLGRVHP